MERPILFSTDMVQALIAERKTQTRRVIKLQPGEGEYYKNLGDGEFAYISNGGISGPYKCPYGKVGDLLWVRENWQIKGWCFDDGEMQINYQAGGHLWVDIHDPKEDSSWIQNQIEQLEAKGVLVMSETDEDYFEFTEKPQPWKPSIHMPKEAARIWLKVTNVRVERLHDISKRDSLAEGVFEIEKDEAYTDYMKQAGAYAGPIGSFLSLWESINGLDSVLANPWVWVIEFEVVSTTGRANVKEVQA